MCLSATLRLKPLLQFYREVVCAHCTTCITPATQVSLRNSVVPSFINSIRAEGLIDTGNRISFIIENFANLARLKKRLWHETISMASLTFISQVTVVTQQAVQLGENSYDIIQL